MKKENVINSLLGFPIGIAILMINYASVYLIAGEDIFKSEILQLQNISVLILQLIIIGLAYYLFFIFISVISKLNEPKYFFDKLMREHPYKKTILFMIIFIIIINIIITLLDFKIFSKNISIINLFTFIIVFVSCALYFCIKSTIESDLVKKINQKLKERNN